MKRKLLASILSLIMVLGLCTTAFAGTWKSDDIGWWWQRDDGSYPANGWEWVDDNGDGIEECYYFNPEGYCLIDSPTPDGYVVDANGAWIVDGAVQHQQSSSSAAADTASSSTGSGTVYTEITTGMRNALDRANSYLRLMPFSYTGLISQLKYEGYTDSEATYAADSCGANWSEQALKKAQNYLDIMAFSYSGLVSQLEYEGYTSSEATYAVDNCGADWNEQAAKKAESYMSIMSFSRSGLINQLKYEGFSQSQAEYGAAAVGY